VLIDVDDMISFNDGSDIYSNTFDKIWCKHSISSLIDYLNDVLNYDILSFDYYNWMIKINSYFHILNISERIRYILGLDKNKVIRFLPSHGSPYIIVRYKQSSNHYNKVMENNIMNNQ
jgi:hypothetical protein